MPPDLITAPNLPAAWVARWSERPAARALHDGHKGWLTAAGLETATRRASRQLRSIGLQGGDRILISGPANARTAIAVVAALRLALTVIPMNPAYTRREVHELTRDASPAGALIESAEVGSWVRQATSDQIPVVDDLNAIPAHADAPLDVVAGNAPALLVYTSGTTGRPKGVPLSHENILASLEGLRRAWQWSSDDILAITLPLFHLHGLGVGLFGALYAGSPLVLNEKFIPDFIFDAGRELGATMFFGVPTMYARLSISPRIRELSRLRLCVSGSAPLPADLHRALMRVCGQSILERYGMTETMMLMSNPLEGTRRPGTVGFPLPGVDAQLVGGEIRVKGPNVFKGYWNNTKESAAAFDETGYFKTGDLGAIDEIGYWRITGRLKELIITGGQNVSPTEVEDVIRRYPNVADVAVVGMASEEWGESVAAAVVQRGVCDQSGLERFVADNLAPYKRPRTVRFTGSIPRNALGKVDRVAVRRLISDR